MWWLIGFALAQDRTPPAAVTEAALEDLGAWEARGRQLLDGPPGCVEFAGSVRFSVALFRPGGWFGPGERKDMVLDGHFQGRLDHGTWTGMALTWSDPVEGADTLDLDRLHPIVGRLPPEEGAENGAGDGAEDGAAKGSVSVGVDGSGTTVAVAQGSEQALGMLDQIIQDIDPAVTTGYATWDGDRRAVVSTQLVPLDGRQGDLELSVLFPEGGAPTALDAIFPARVHGGKGPLSFTLIDAQLHVRGQPSALGVLPVEEGVSAVLGVLGFTLGIDQHIRYERARACGASAGP